MPRIDPIQLLNCLSVLLSPNGGIKSRDEVQRLANLMVKYSKKLVSKCIYIQILKCTDSELLGLFMGNGGWILVHMWLTESIVAKNWPLVRELLELLLLCPVDIERLKTNNCPKLVKELSKDDNNFAIRILASKLVEQWLKTVKGEDVKPLKINELPNIISYDHTDINSDNLTKDETLAEPEHSEQISACNDNSVNVDYLYPKIEVAEVPPNTDSTVLKDSEEKDPASLPVLKISLKDGKQVVSEVHDIETKINEDIINEEASKEKRKSRSKEKASHDRRESSKSSKSSSKQNTSQNDKHLSSSSSDKHNDSSKSSHKSSNTSRHLSSKDKSKERDRSSSHSTKSKDSYRRTSSSSKEKTKEERSSKSSEKTRNKDDKKSDKNKDVLKSVQKSEDKPEIPSIQKLGKIPKLSDVKKEKPSISIEVRKPEDPKPKTVKTFHSKFRKHGLEEEVKPPPPRAAVLNKKPPPVIPPTVSIPKRSSPIHNEIPEKKPRIVENVEKPGAIKLIPPKPKPVLLLESDMFMDALNASATNKKEPKKRKRRTSGSKDGSSNGDSSPPHTPSAISSPSSEKTAPPRFYQDTLDTDELKDKAEKDSDGSQEMDESVNKESSDNEEPATLTINGLKGVLCYHKKRGPKKSIKWKPDSELEEVQYFELDETERVNVTKTFTDMKYLERINERDCFQKARNISTDDTMEEKTNWRSLIPLDIEGQIQVEHGKNSKEKDIQALRQKGTLQPLYFHKSMIPDSAFEPEPETHTYSEPTIIPLEDVTGNQDNISDFRNMPWPEPKGNAPVANTNLNVPPMFPTNMGQFPNGFPGTQFPGVPGFPGAPGPNMMPAEWQGGIPPHMMPNPMGPMGLPPGTLPPGNMPPGMMVPSEDMMMAPEMFNGPNPLFPGPPEGFNMQPNMFPVDFNMPGPGPQGHQGPDGFPGNFRGNMRGRGAGGHWRGKSGGNWDGPPRGRGGHSRGGRKAVCIYFQRKGSCRQGDNCSFLHPGVNCPY